MKLVSTGLTRRILNAAINLHRRAVAAKCYSLDRRADSLFDAADRQKGVVASARERLEAARERLEAARLAAGFAEQEADAAWRAADAELAQYPVRP